MDDPSLVLTIEDQPNAEDRDFILRNLTAHNEAVAGNDNYRPLAVYLRNEDDEIVGGLVGTSFYRWLVIDLLWVSESFRGRGLGTQLLRGRRTGGRQSRLHRRLSRYDVVPGPWLLRKTWLHNVRNTRGNSAGTNSLLHGQALRGVQPMTSGFGSSKRPLKVGIMLPESEREMAGDTAGWSDFLEMARATEDLGFDSLWFADHLLMRVPGYDIQGAWDCWSMLAALAATTTRIELAPFVTCTGYRNPALIAKIAETVDEISNGRLILGLGAGWAEPEYAAFGFPFDHRASRFEEALAIIVPLMRTGKVDFKGEFYSAVDCELRPRGPRPSGMPIMIGTFGGERMMKLTAQHADHWNVWSPWTGNRASGVPALRDKMDAICREVGRDSLTLERSAAVMIDFPGAYGRPGQTVPSLTGSPEELAKSSGRTRGKAFAHPALSRSLHRGWNRSHRSSVGAT